MSVSLNIQAVTYFRGLIQNGKIKNNRGHWGLLQAPAPTTETTAPKATAATPAAQRPPSSATTRL